MPDTPLLVLLLCLMKSVKELLLYPLSRAAGRPVSGKASAKVHFLSEPAKLFAIFFSKNLKFSEMATKQGGSKHSYTLL